MSLISLQKTMIDLDGRQSMQKYLGEQLRRAILTTAEYAVEIDPEKLRQCRENLQKIAQRAESAPTSAEVDTVQASFRGEVRLYRDQAHEALSQLRAELCSARDTMRNLSEGMMHSGKELQRSVNKELGVLKQTAQQDDITIIRKAIDDASEAITSSCTKLKQQQDLVVAQLLDEIQTLHKQAEKERRAAQTDPDTGAWNRQKLDSKITDLILLNQPFCLFLIVIGNDPQLAQEHSSARYNGAIRVMLERARQLLKDDTMEGRWSRNTFALLTDLAASSLPVNAQRIEDALRRRYSIQDDGAAHEVFLDVHVRLVERLRGMSEAEFYPHIGQAIYKIGGR